MKGALDAAPDLSYEAIVGRTAHILVGLAATHRSERPDELRERIWQASGRLIRLHPELRMRARAARISAAGAAAVYARFFMPDERWSLAGNEVEIPDGRIDLVWHGTEGHVLYDELKVALGRAQASGDGPTRRQAARYLAHGTRTHGEHFAGVRVLLLGAPRHSLLLTGESIVPLETTELWFAARKEVH